MNLRQLGLRIKEQRERRGLRQADVANALQISSQAVSKWERGENAPDISVLVGLARLLDASVEWLLGGTSAETDTFSAVVFCTSLKGFARKAASMPPREGAAWANGVYYTLTEAMRRQDGVPTSTSETVRSASSPATITRIVCCGRLANPDGCWKAKKWSSAFTRAMSTSGPWATPTTLGLTSSDKRSTRRSSRCRGSRKTVEQVYRHHQCRLGTPAGNGRPCRTRRRDRVGCSDTNHYH